MTKPLPPQSFGRWRLPGTSQRLTKSEVFEIVSATNKKSYAENAKIEISIGTDSQPSGEELCFVTALCVHHTGKGGIYYYTREVIRPPLYILNNPKLRMLDEVNKSIHTAVDLREATGLAATVHIDASPPTSRAFTAQFSEQLKGHVLASGLECVLKPCSYAANAVADRHTKKKQGCDG